MSGSKSNSKQSTSTSTTDQRTTATINAGISGDTDDSIIMSGIDGDVAYSNEIDNSSYEYDFEDNRSWDFEDDRSYDDSVEDSIVFREITGGVTVTDGGAFDLARDVVNALKESQAEVLDSANKLADMSVSAVANTTLGEKTISDNAKQVEFAKMAAIGLGLTAVGVAVAAAA